MKIKFLMFIALIALIISGCQTDGQAGQSQTATSLALSEAKPTQPEATPTATGIPTSAYASVPRTYPEP